MRVRRPFSSSSAAVAGAALSILALAGATHAAPMIYTDRSSFDTAIFGMTASTLNFDSETAGTLIGDGDTLGGITFSYTTLAGFGVTMKIVDAADTTSPANSLGTDDGDVFQGGDEFDLGFSPVNAIGMYFITSPDLIEDGDLTLSVGLTTANLAAGDLQDTLADGGQVYFLGIVDAMSTFSMASVSGSGPFFLFNVDDIVTAITSNGVPAVPEPDMLALFGVGIAGLGYIRRRRNKRH